MKKSRKKASGRIIIKGVIALVVFAVLFGVFQALLTPKFVGESTTMVDGLKQIDTTDLKVLFLGSSQMFCAVDARTLTEKYNISSYDYGASNQCLSITLYYLNEALKHCHPELVMVEVGNAYYANSEVDETALTWNYAPADMSIAKYRSLLSVTGERSTAALHTFCPLFLYHSRWSELNRDDIRYYLDYYKKETYLNRGFLERTEIVPQEMQYYKSEDESAGNAIPDENKAAMQEIVRVCSEEGIRVVFFKVPVPFWTKSLSKPVEDFMQENGFEYVDFHTCLDEIDLDEKTDYRDDHHANATGAEKITEYIGAFLKKNGF